MIRIVRIAIFITAFIIIGYLSGYANAVYNCAILNSIITSQYNIHSVKYLVKNEPDRALFIQTSELESRIAAIEDILKNRYKLSQIPSRIGMYRIPVSSLKADHRIRTMKVLYNELAEQLGSHKDKAYVSEH